MFLGDMNGVGEDERYRRLWLKILPRSDGIIGESWIKRDQNSSMQE